MKKLILGLILAIVALGVSIFLTKELVMAGGGI